MEKVGIFFGSSSGNTEGAAGKIQEALGGEVEVMNVSDAKAADIEKFKNVIFGSSTWGIGDLQDDFEDFMSEIEAADLNGKKVAIYGTGDQESYPDSFVDSIGTIYEALQGKGCDIVGQVATDGYEYDESKAEVDGKFVGLPLDEDNQGDETDDRIAAWVEILKKEFV